METLAQKKFNIYSSFTLSSDDVSALSLLYSALIGADAVGLYLCWQSLLERRHLKSETLMHQELYDILNLNEKNFLKQRYQLEGIGLMSSYVKDEEYCYVLHAPLSPKNFIKDATFGLYLYGKIGKDLFEKLCEHFTIAGFPKEEYENITKNFDDVFTSQIDEDVSFSKFQYLLGRKPKTFKIKHQDFDFSKFVEEINVAFLETGVTPGFTKQIINLAFVYQFDELQMAQLFHDSINQSGYFDSRLLKKKANILYSYLNHINAPKLIVKNDYEPSDMELENYLDTVAPTELLGNLMSEFPPKYLQIISEIYANIDLPRGVLNCMIIKVLKEKSGELPSFSYFKKMSTTWIENNVFTTKDAIQYVTGFGDGEKPTGSTGGTVKYKTGGFESL